MTFVYRVFINLLILTIIFSCKLDNTSLNVRIPDGDYINPTYNFPSNNVVEADEGYPHPIKQFPYSSKAIRSVNELKEFCSSIKKKFYFSNATNEEAEKFLNMLSQNLTIRDESYGMPSPNYPPKKPVKLKERVLIRKLSEYSWEIFYYRIGCGKNYIYSRVVIKEGVLEIEPLERWSESYPC